MATTFQALRLLASLGGEYGPNVRRAVDFIVETQGHDGSWAGSVLQTSAAVRALREPGLGAEVGAAVGRAKGWLRSREAAGGGWAGEPLIYYWFETAPGQKVLFHCRDKGKVTSAWAKLALAA